MDDSKVAILLEDLRAQFQVFGEGMQMLRDQANHIEQKLDMEIEQNAREHLLNRQEHQLIIEQNRQEHKQMMQMVQELNHDFQVELKRVK